MAATGDAVSFSLAELARSAGAELDGDGSVRIHRVASLEGAGPGAIAFLAHLRHRTKLASTRASAVIVPLDAADATALPKLLTANPYAAYARVAALLHPAPPVEAGVHRLASVDASAAIHASAAIGAFAVVGPRAGVGARAVVGAHCVIGDEAAIGDDAVLDARVTVYPRCVIGPRTLIHSGAVIGADGFGLALDDGVWRKIPQVGRVVIGADVEIGANTTIDRGAIDDTVIEDDVKLDNQIQIGHNCVIGAHTAIAGCVGIAGSTRIGRGCRIGGAAMISGHLEICAGTTVSAATLVFNSILAPGVYTGTFPALPHGEWKFVASQVRRLRQMANRIRLLENASEAARPAHATKGESK
ncbi:MAG: UDP-3-O-(3-hydroxymyristoyl)glucosamine N-acyltransferase [Betaproteobacteria bacterium]